MFTRAVAVAVGLAFAAVPGSAQTDHQHEHGQDQESPEIPNMMMREMMTACPFSQAMGMHSRMMGMMGSGTGDMMDHEMMGGMGGQESGMMGAGVTNHGMMGLELPGPHYMIGMKEDLNLSEAQVEKLETLASRASQAVEVHMRQAVADRVRATELLGRNVGLKEYAEALRSSATHMAEAHIAMARSGFEAQNLLTPEQREAVSVPRTGIHGRHETSMRMNGSGGHDFGQTQSET